jgi:hypothetical protein
MRRCYLDAFTKSLFDTDLVASRSILALAEFTWAILLFWPGDTFARPTYTHMSHVFNETTWAFIFLGSGLMQTYLVLHEEFHTVLARVFAGWNASLWLYIVVSMLLSVYPPPAAISGEIALAFSAFWIWLRPFIIYKGVLNARSV